MAARRRIEMKRIEDRASRLVTFSKRRKGLFKKAQEISVLCDVEVAVVIFSSKGKVYEFSSRSCVEETFERYRKHANSEREVMMRKEEFRIWRKSKSFVNSLQVKKTEKDREQRGVGQKRFDYHKLRPEKQIQVQEGGDTEKTTDKEPPATFLTLGLPPTS